MTQPERKLFVFVAASVLWRGKSQNKAHIVIEIFCSDATASDIHAARS